MQRTIVYCDRCNTQMTDQEHWGDVHGITLSGLPDKESLFCSVNVKTPHGSRGKGGHLHGTHFCGEKCFKEALNSMLTRAGLGLEVVDGRA